MSFPREPTDPYRNHGDPHDGPGGRIRVALTSRSGPHFETEIRGLLRWRLLVISGMTSAALSAYMLFFLSEPLGITLNFRSHGLVLAFLVALTVLLRSRMLLSLSHLRFVELAMFGAVAFLFAWEQSAALTDGREGWRDGVIYSGYLALRWFGAGRGVRHTDPKHLAPLRILGGVHGPLSPGGHRRVRLVESLGRCECVRGVSRRDGFLDGVRRHGHRFRLSAHQVLAPSGIRGPRTRSVPAGAVAGRWRYGGRLLRRTPAAPSAVCHQADSPGTRRRFEAPTSVRTRGARDGEAYPPKHSPGLRLRPHRRWRVLLRHGIPSRPGPRRVGDAVRPTAASPCRLPSAAGVRGAAGGPR